MSLFVCLFVAVLQLGTQKLANLNSTSLEVIVCILLDNFIAYTMERISCCLHFYSCKELESSFSCCFSSYFHQTWDLSNIQLGFHSPKYILCLLTPLGQSKLPWAACCSSRTFILLLHLLSPTSYLRLLNHTGKLPFYHPSFLPAETLGQIKLPWTAC